MLHQKKSIVITLLGAAVIFIATTAMKAPKQDPGFKNLKVLPKDISKEDLDKVMDQWRDALGVRCGFCHARDAATNKTDFASDAKPEKEITRKMMEMTKQINEKYFKEDKEEKHDGPMLAAVACYTCHNGKAQPANVAPPRVPGQGGFGGPPGGAPPAGGGTPPPAGTPPPTTNPPAHN